MGAFIGMMILGGMLAGVSFKALTEKNGPKLLQLAVFVSGLLLYLAGAHLTNNEWEQLLTLIGQN
jgi:hypothetical protein